MFIDNFYTKEKDEKCNMDFAKVVKQKVMTDFLGGWSLSADDRDMWQQLLSKLYKKK